MEKLLEINEDIQIRVGDEMPYDENTYEEERTTIKSIILSSIDNAIIKKRISESLCICHKHFGKLYDSIFSLMMYYILHNDSSYRGFVYVYNDTGRGIYYIYDYDNVNWVPFMSQEQEDIILENREIVEMTMRIVDKIIVIKYDGKTFLIDGKQFSFPILKNNFMLWLKDYHNKLYNIIPNDEEDF